MTLPTRTPIESNHAIEYFLRMQSDKAIAEALKGIYIHGPFMSMHEGFAVLKEEVDELWHELMSNNIRLENNRPDSTYEECVQIAAIALRLGIAHRRMKAHV